VKRLVALALPMLAVLMLAPAAASDLEPIQSIWHLQMGIAVDFNAQEILILSIPGQVPLTLADESH
jgi:hypothetical protein